VFLHALTQDQEREQIDPATGQPSKVARQPRSSY